MPKIFVGEPLSVSLVSSIENIYALEGYVTIFRRKHFVSQNRKTLHGNHSVLCFGKFPVTNNFMDEKRVVYFFYVEFFCLTLSKTAVGELFSLSLISGIEKVRMRDWGGGGSVTIFRRKILVSQCQKNS